MRILVTGGAGFIGSHLVGALLEQGHEVSVFDLVDPVPARKHVKAIYERGDIRDVTLAAAVARLAPEVIFHLAADADDRKSVLDPYTSASHNVFGTVNLFEAALHAGVRKVIFASTGVVYGLQKELPVTESAVPQPLTPYAVSKLAGEKYGHYYAHERGLLFAGLRIANVYGPLQDGSKEVGAIAVFTNYLLQHKAPFMNGDGLTTRDYIHVTDVVSAFLCLLSDEAHGMYNAGTGIQTTTQEVYSLVSQALQSSVVPTPRPEVNDVLKHVALSPVRLTTEFSWKPQVVFAEGVRSTVDFYKHLL
ncbi:NAD-dependent epimerase/dehydratase family protein [Patescibacteria group bacterium]|nr:NAD-dependent epimerase/dehydratase family protein [Patescibacteria group bacterium]